MKKIQIENTWYDGDGVFQWANDEAKVAIKQIAALQKREIEGKTVSEDEWLAARSAIWSTAESATRPAWSAIWSTVRSLARSTARSAESAIWSARSATEPATWSAHYEKMADKLVSLLKAVPVEGGKNESSNMD